MEQVKEAALLSYQHILYHLLARSHTCRRSINQVVAQAYELHLVFLVENNTSWKDKELLLDEFEIDSIRKEYHQEVILSKRDYLMTCVAYS